MSHSFLDLPGEIRNEIYKHALSSLMNSNTLHAQLASTFAIHPPTREEYKSHSTPQWIRNWYSLRSTCHPILLEIDSFVSADVFPQIVINVSVHDTKYKLSNMPGAFRSRLQRVEISDYGFLLCNWNPNIATCFSKVSKSFRIHEGFKADQRTQEAKPATVSGGICRELRRMDKAQLMLQHYIDIANELIQIPQLKQVVLTFGHWNDRIRITEDALKKAAFMYAFAEFVNLLGKGGTHGGHSINNVTVLCQDTDLQQSDFEMGLGWRDIERDKMPFPIKLQLQGSDERVSISS